MKRDGVKAQSDIITVVLVILIVLVAIVIVWNVVNLTLKKSSGEASVSQFVLSGELKYSMSAVKDSVNVSVHRSSGKGNITGIKLIFEFPDGTRSYENRIKYPDELETKTYEITGDNLNPKLIPSDFSTLKMISVYYIYNESNKEKITIPIDTAEGPSTGGTTVTPPCPPNCGSRVCGPDPVCGQSCGPSCPTGQSCNSSGQCVNIVCNTDSQCGTNEFIGNLDCLNSLEGGNVTQNYITHTCNHPGTPQSSCTDSTIPTLKQSCGRYGCYNGICLTATSWCDGADATKDGSVGGEDYDLWKLYVGRDDCSATN